MRARSTLTYSYLTLNYAGTHQPRGSADQALTQILARHSSRAPSIHLRQAARLRLRQFKPPLRGPPMTLTWRPVHTSKAGCSYPMVDYFPTAPAEGADSPNGDPSGPSLTGCSYPVVDLRPAHTRVRGAKPTPPYSLPPAPLRPDSPLVLFN